VSRRITVCAIIRDIIKNSIAITPALLFLSVDSQQLITHRSGSGTTERRRVMTGSDGSRQVSVLDVIAAQDDAAGVTGFKVRSGICG
jgi:hypothetical protein